MAPIIRNVIVKAIKPIKSCILYLSPNYIGILIVGYSSTPNTSIFNLVRLVQNTGYPVLIQIVRHKKSYPLQDSWFGFVWFGFSLS